MPLPTLLLVEDNAGDAELLRLALEETVALDLVVRNSGSGAQRLLQAALAGERERPDLVVLDLNLPGLSGLELLEWVKAEPGLRSLPVIVLSSSSAARDVHASYERHANAYLCKARSFEGYLELAAALAGFWLRCAVLPRIPA